MEYIRALDSKGCIFCDEAGGPADRDRLILHRGSHAIVLLNRFPYAPGHLMVAPLEHRARLQDLPADCRAELMERLADASRILEAHYDCDGLNVGANLGRAAGAGFADHLHFHLVPRWEGDANFMTVVGEQRVMPTFLETTLEELEPQFAELSS